jgi:hypothetical protein
MFAELGVAEVAHYSADRVLLSAPLLAAVLQRHPQRKPLAHLSLLAANLSALCCQVSSMTSSLPLVVGRMGELQGRLVRSLAVARRGLELLADQLVALGALNGRASPNKNPLAGTCRCVC